MAGLLFTLLAVILTGVGSRDQATVAMLTRSQGQRPMLLAFGIVISVATAVAAAWAATIVIPLLPGRARMVMAAMALGLAGIELLFIGSRRQAKEPTLSLGAAGIVILAHQVTDAARFLIFAIAVATTSPIPAGIGGAIGGAVSLAAAWFAPELLTDPRLRRVRMAIGAALILLAAMVGFQAIG